MMKSGLADSPFFAPRPITPIPIPTPIGPIVEKPAAPKASIKRSLSLGQGKQKTSNHDTTTPRNHGTVVSSNHDPMVETVRKAVRELGKEAATHRFTVEEKRGVLDLIYSYKGSGVRTSENEVARIAINFILEDYKQNGRNSILDRVLKALNE